MTDEEKLAAEAEAILKHAGKKPWVAGPKGRAKFNSWGRYGPPFEVGDVQLVDFFEGRQDWPAIVRSITPSGRPGDYIVYFEPVE